tara:strand:- start:49 stop:465 length:417 start_codon:yes stop_codon:yes gene_type:complete
MAIKKKLSKELSDLISEYLSKGGKVKKVPAGKAKNANEKANVKPKNLPRDKQGKTLKFDADGDIKFKDGGTVKQKIKKLRNKKLTPKEEAELKRLSKLPSSGVEENTPPKPKPKPKLQGGGLVLRVLNKGVISGSKKT